MSGTIIPKIVTDGLVLYLDAANSKSFVSGSTSWYDLSKSSANGNLTNGPKYNLDKRVSLQFDGFDDFGSIPHTLQNQYTNKLSINIWVKPTWFDSGNNDGVTLFSKCLPSLISPYTIISVAFTTAGKFASSIGDGAARVFCVSTNTVSLNTWVNVCMTYDASTIRLYINGSQDPTTAACSYIIGQNTVPFTIASNQTLGGFYDWFKGNIGMIQMYNKGLSAAEVLQNYNATKRRYL